MSSQASKVFICQGSGDVKGGNPVIPKALAALRSSADISVNVASPSEGMFILPAFGL